MKRCTQCGETKILSAFSKTRRRKDGLHSYCKTCGEKCDRLWYVKNKERAKENAKRWQMDNPEKHRIIRKNARIKRKNNPRGKLNINMSRGIWESLKGSKAGRHWEVLVGYTLNKLKQHLERQFKQGMTWENYGKYGWHIDHIIPIAAFNFEKPEDIDFRKCWALKNLRPLEAKENLRKQAKIDKPFQPSFIYSPRPLPLNTESNNSNV